MLKQILLLSLFFSEGKVILWKIDFQLQLSVLAECRNRGEEKKREDRHLDGKHMESPYAK